MEASPPPPLPRRGRPSPPALSLPSPHRSLPRGVRPSHRPSPQRLPRPAAAAAANPVRGRSHLHPRFRALSPAAGGELPAPPPPAGSHRVRAAAAPLFKSNRRLPRLRAAPNRPPDGLRTAWRLPTTWRPPRRQPAACRFSIPPPPPARPAAAAVRLAGQRPPREAVAGCPRGGFAPRRAEEEPSGRRHLAEGAAGGRGGQEPSRYFLIGWAKHRDAVTRWPSG